MAGEQGVGGSGADAGHHLQAGPGVDAAAFGIAQAHRGAVPSGCAAGPGRAHFVGGGADQHHAHGTAPGHRAQLLGQRAVEGAAGVIEALGGAAEHHRDLAAQVQPGEVVVAQARGVHGLADENGGGVDGSVRAVEVGHGQELVLEGERGGPAFEVDLQPRAFGSDARAQQRHALEPAAAVAGGDEAGFGKARGNVVGGEVEAGGAGFAALHAVVGGGGGRLDAVRGGSCERVALAAVVLPWPLEVPAAAPFPSASRWHPDRPGMTRASSSTAKALCRVAAWATGAGPGRAIPVTRKRLTADRDWLLNAAGNTRAATGIGKVQRDKAASLARSGLAQERLADGARRGIGLGRVAVAEHHHGQALGGPAQDHVAEADGLAGMPLQAAVQAQP